MINVILKYLKSIKLKQNILVINLIILICLIMFLKNTLALEYVK